MAVDTASVTEIIVGLWSHLDASSLKRSEAALFSSSIRDIFFLAHQKMKRVIEYIYIMIFYRIFFLKL